MAYRFNSHENFYEIPYNHGTIYLEDPDLVYLMYLYTNKGLNKSKEDCLALLSTPDFQLDKQDLNAILKAFKITKALKYVLTPNDLEVFGHSTEVEVDNINRAKVRYDKHSTRVALNKALKDAGSNITPFPAPNFPTVTETSDDVVILAFSDWHLGLRVEYDGLLRYDSKVFATRLKKVWSQIKTYAERSKKPKKVVLVFLGDLLEGPNANFRLGQLEHMELVGKSQVKFAGHCVAKTIQFAVQTFNSPVDIYAVPGNHDRGSSSAKDDIHRLPHLQLISFAKRYLEDYNKNQLVNWCCTDRRWVSTEIDNNIRLILTHGDSKHTPAKLARADSKHSADLRLVLQGHWHKRYYEECIDHTHIIVPSLVGLTEYVDFELAQLNSKPGQALIEVCTKTAQANVRFLNV